MSFVPRLSPRHPRRPAGASFFIASSLTSNRAQPPSAGRPRVAGWRPTDRPDSANMAPATVRRGSLQKHAWRQPSRTSSAGPRPSEIVTPIITLTTNYLACYGLAEVDDSPCVISAANETLDSGG